MDVTITKEQQEMISYFINDWMHLMGYGGEYRKLIELSLSLQKSGFDFSNYHSIRSGLGSNYERRER